MNTNEIDQSQGLVRRSLCRRKLARGDNEATEKNITMQWNYEREFHIECERIKWKAFLAGLSIISFVAILNLHICVCIWRVVFLSFWQLLYSNFHVELQIFFNTFFRITFLVVFLHLSRSRLSILLPDARARSGRIFRPLLCGGSLFMTLVWKMKREEKEEEKESGDIYQVVRKRHVRTPLEPLLNHADISSRLFPLLPPPPSLPYIFSTSFSSSSFFSRLIWDGYVLQYS